MKIKDLIYETPEMTEEKLLTIINENLKMVDSFLKKRLRELHKDSSDLCQAFLDEYDLIQDKKSLLTASQRKLVSGFVGYCMIKMTKGEDGTTGK
jgi:hypothetical protein